MGSLLSSGAPQIPKAIGTAQDYINAFNPSQQGSGSDVGGLLGGGSGILGDLGKAASLGSLVLPPLSPIGFGLSLTSAIPQLISMFSGRSSTGPGSATADIAGAGSNYSDPIIKLLSAGAANLPSGTPISASDGSASSFGPYFDAARRAEDLIRWGSGGTTDKNAQALDATTLKNALTEMGNPGKAGTGTLTGIQDAWNKFIQNNPEGSPGWNQLLQLQNQMSGPEKAIFEQFFKGGGGDGGPGQPPGSPPGVPPGSPPNLPGLSFNPISANSNPLSAIGAVAPLLIAAQNINPMSPIKLPDVQPNSVGPGNNQQKKSKNNQSNLIAQLLSLLSQNGQSQ